MKYAVCQVILRHELVDISDDKFLTSLRNIEIDSVQAVKLFLLENRRSSNPYRPMGARDIFRFTSIGGAIEAAERNREKFVSFRVIEELALAIFSGNSCFLVTSNYGDASNGFCSRSSEYHADRFIPGIESTNVISLRQPERLSPWTQTSIRQGGNLGNALMSFCRGEGYIDLESEEIFSVFKIERTVCFTPVLWDDMSISVYRSRPHDLYPAFMAWKAFRRFTSNDFPYEGLKQFTSYVSHG